MNNNMMELNALEIEQISGGLIDPVTAAAIIGACLALEQLGEAAGKFLYGITH